MKEKVLELYSAGHNINKIAAMLMIQKSEVERIVNNLEAKKNSKEITPAVVEETSKKKKK